MTHPTAEIEQYKKQDYQFSIEIQKLEDELERYSQSKHAKEYRIKRLNQQIETMKAFRQQSRASLQALNEQTAIQKTKTVVVDHEREQEYAWMRKRPATDLKEGILKYLVVQLPRICQPDEERPERCKAILQQSHWLQRLRWSNTDAERFCQTLEKYAK